MIAALKAIHIATIMLWTAGLLALPTLYTQRNGLPEGPALDRLHRQVRFVYVTLLSPAAVIAISSGIALIFLQQTYHVWFSLKIGAVAVLVGLHVFTAPVILRLFDPGERYAPLRALFSTSVTALVVLAILALVLVKPPLADGAGSETLRPGGLQRLLPGFTPPPLP